MEFLSCSRKLVCCGDRPAVGTRYPEETTLPRTSAVQHHAPRWARWCLGIGALLLIASGGSVIATRVLLTTATGSITQQNLLGTVRTGTSHVQISGPKNILLVGLDTRPGQTTQASRSDSIILLHIAADHTHGYLISLPRDSYVTIPAYDNGKARYPGGHNKINSAFAFGSQGLTGSAALSHGFELLALTVKKLTGITPDAGAIIDFQGFKNVVQVLGRVCMYVDENTTSIHIGHTADGRFATPYKTHQDGTIWYKIPGVTPNFYAKGNHCFTPVEALDYVRQRDLLADHDYDYGRQRHQQQFVKAILKQVVHDGLNSPTKLPGLLSAVGKTMTVDSGGISLADWAFAMRDVKPDNLVTIKTNDGKFNSRSVPGIGSVEILDDTSLQLLQAARDDTVDQWVMANPTWVSTS
jgi:anionic cell wall polymer biosynthesis LytR-Cps2A-Psr (LCP) family protein